MTWSFSGGEINDTEIRVRRRVWVDDRNDLLSPMHYEVELLQLDKDETNLSDVQVAVLTVLDEVPITTSEVEAATNTSRTQQGQDPFAKRSIQVALKSLHEEHGLADRSGEEHSGYSWRRSAAEAGS